MKKILLSKGGNKFRTIYMPDDQEKRILRALVPQLNLLAEELDKHHVQHGFTEGRSPVTNATIHIGWEYTVNFDLQDFFDSVTRDRIRLATVGKIHPSKWVMLPALIQDCFPFGAARQGLPTSPALANIAAVPIDNDIMALCKQGRFTKPTLVYSRYADDLTISVDTIDMVNMLLVEVPKIVEKHGFKINPAKTKVQCARAGRRIITGISIDDKAAYIPRETKRRIRAGEHQTKAGLKRRNIRRMLFRSKLWKRKLPLFYRFQCQLQGLKEWAKLTRPKNEPKKQNPVTRVAVRVVTAIAGHKAGERLKAFARKFA